MSLEHLRGKWQKFRAVYFFVMTIVYPGVLAPGAEFHPVIRPRTCSTPALCWLWPHSVCVREDDFRLGVNCVSEKGEGHSVGWPSLMSLPQSLSHSYRNSSIHCLKLFCGPEGPLMLTNHLGIFFYSPWENIGHKDCHCKLLSSRKSHISQKDRSYLIATNGPHNACEVPKRSPG